MGAGPLSPAEPGENQTLAAVPRAGKAPQMSCTGFAKGTVTRNACLEQTGWFFPGKFARHALGWGRSARAPHRPLALGRARPVPRSQGGTGWACWGSVGVSEKGAVLASPNVVDDKSRREGSLRSQPASVPCFVLHGLPAKCP